MKVQLLTPVAGPGIGMPDDNGVVEVSADVGTDLVKAGHAAEVKPAAKKPTAKKPATG